MQPILAKWAAGAGQTERVLLFREGRVNAARRAKRHARRLRHVKRRALLRRLERVTAQLERTPEYRQSLQSVLDLGRQLQSVLDATQRERWLALEEALFDHSSRLHRAYFCAGVEYGTALAASVAGDEASAGGAAANAYAASDLMRAGVPSSAILSPVARRTAALELELLSALARWLGKLTRE